SAYHILFSSVLIANLALLATVHITSHPPLTPSTAMLATSTNLLLALLIRNEHIINLFFTLLSRLASGAYTPPFLKRRIADFHHYGGLHSSAALGAVLWYIQYTALKTMSLVYLLRLRSESTGEYGRVWRAGDEAKMEGWECVDVALCYTVLLILLAICITALPGMRRRWHNLFEKTHRFGGWASIVGLWVHVVGQSFAMQKYVAAGVSLVPLWKTPAFYLLLGITGLVVHPWLYVRRVRVATAVVDPHSTTLIFPYNNMPASSTMRFSTNPLTEWHAFATIPSATGLPAAKIIVARAGDWTDSLIHDPPQNLWIRRLPARNFLAFARCWDRILLVGTGAGIGPVVSFLGSVKRQAERGGQVQKLVKVLWCARDPFSAEWEHVRRAIERVDPGPWILESRSKSGGRGAGRNKRPDLLEESKAMVREYGLQAAFVVGNKTVTDVIVGGLKAVGIPGYGAVFDS
ncbi:hypothetical protein K491DRAFT_564359, partial [Lophiostoma macrostomum CBS 122681]